MKTESFKFESKDSVKISAQSWLPKRKRKLKGIVQIVHGMAEHIGRYQDFAAELVENGYGVYGHDHRGHGGNVEDEKDFSFFGADQGWAKIVDDAHALTLFIKNKHDGVPVFLYGHSLGSSISRYYVIKYNREKLQGFLMSGMTGHIGLPGRFAYFLAKLLTKIQGPETKSPLFDKLLFGAFNKSFKPNRTDFDWLTSDNKHVDEYIKDPLCGHIFAIVSYRDIVGMVISINKIKNIKKVSKDLPILLLSGEHDPVTNKTKGLLQVKADYKKAGVKNVSHIIYENFRHEVLNEKNREKVYKDCIEWLDSHC